MDIEDTSEFIDLLTKISSELDFDIPEFHADIEKMEDRERVRILIQQSPIIYNIYCMHEQGHIDYETALQKMVVALFNSNKFYKDKCEELIMNHPQPILKT